MARATFGGTSSDFVFSTVASGLIRLSPATLTFWTADVGGSQVTDLLLGPDPVSTVTVGADGQIPEFQGPDNVLVLWADAGAGDRVAMVAVRDVADQAQAAAAAAELAADQAEAFGGTNNEQVAAMVNGAGPTKDALAATYVAQVKPTGGNDATMINALFAAGAMEVDGSGRTFNITSSITVPEGATLRFGKLVLGTPGMSGVLVNHRSKVYGHIVGTGTIGSSGSDFYERGVYPAVDGASDVELDVTVENMTLGVNPRPLDTLVPKRWTGTIRAKNIVGFTGNSEGYALLMSPASDCDLTLISNETKRHALYLSNGATGNKIDVIANGGDHAPVQLYSTAAQPACRNNHVTAILSDVNAGIGADATWGVNLFGKVEGNHIDVTIRDSTCEGAVLLRSADASAICQRNTVVVRAYGAFTGDVVRGDASVENTVEVYGKGTTSNAGKNLVGVRPYSSIVVPTTARHCIHLKRLVWDADGTDMVPVLSSVTALRTDIGKGVIDLYNTTATTNLSDFTSGKIDGYVSSESLTATTASLAAGAEGNVTFTFSRSYNTSRVFSVGASMVGVTGAADAPNLTVTSLSATGATVRVKNNTGAAATATVRFRIEGW